MRIAIFGNLYRPIILSQMKILFDFIEGKDITLVIRNRLFELLRETNEFDLSKASPIADDNFEADIALSIGGDGTFLKTAASIGIKKIPILGINIGRLGFLTDVSSHEFAKALEMIIKQDYQIEERSLIKVEMSDNTTFVYPFALNEVAILKQDTSSMISINVMVNGEPINTYQGDGLIISTPTGSTAYSMSVGGPIVVPQSENLIISPVAPHSLSVRPLIIPDNWTVELDVRSRNNSFLVALDGRSQILEGTTKLRISKAPFTIQVIKQHGHTFFDTLKNKLMWGVDKRI